MEEGTLVTLRGRSPRGKNVVNGHGEVWKVIPGAHSNSIAAGKIFLQATDESKFHRGIYPELRWVHPEDDFDFEVIIPEGSAKPPKKVIKPFQRAAVYTNGEKRFTYEEIASRMSLIFGGPFTMKEESGELVIHSGLKRVTESCACGKECSGNCRESCREACECAAETCAALGGPH